MTVGNLRFLKVELPSAGDSLWTVLVNGKEVSTSRDGELYCIPLEEQDGRAGDVVDLIYAGTAHPAAGSAASSKFEAPKFVGLPLNDIEWTFFVPPGMEYYGFGGTMEYAARAEEEIRPFDAAEYHERNNEYQTREQPWHRPGRGWTPARSCVKAGQAERAPRRRSRQALNYSQGQAGPERGRAGPAAQPAEAAGQDRAGQPPRRGALLQATSWTSSRSEQMQGFQRRRVHAGVRAARRAAAVGEGQHGARHGGRQDHRPAGGGGRRGHGDQRHHAGARHSCCGSRGPCRSIRTAT